MGKVEWFEQWFNSPYYSLLYQHRNEQEAQQFVQTLIERLYLDPSKHRVLDLACGSGRHALAFAQKGFRVTALDLSTTLLAPLRACQHPNISIVQADMRHFSLNQTFDLILNAFTSFGYFETLQENRQVLKRVHNHLNPKGYFVLDYLNVPFVLKHLVPQEERHINGIYFLIKRRYTPPFIIKDIVVKEDGKTYAYQERVQAFSLQDLENLLKEAGFTVVDRWGDYRGSPYTEEQPRLILVNQRDENA